jgi:transposase
MIDPDVRNAIYQLHLAGMPLAAISRQLKVSRNTVRAVIRRGGAAPQGGRKDKIHVDPELLRRLHRECGGWLQRVHEKLVEEAKIPISYPTLTRRARELGLGKPTHTRCDHVPDEPGREMQHDTSVYQVKLAERPTRVIASLLYLRYSKRRYLKFYRVFNRFTMKCFLHEALLFWGCAARQCVIDNTNLARLRGSGYSAVIVPEMAAFAARYGFQFLCHALNHPNRKAGEERSFWTVETNFLPGRTFASLEDLNQQALAWATVRLDHKPQGRAGLIPAQAFEHEQTSLTPLPPQLPAPYRVHDRGTDQYGYVCFGVNYYWVPGTRRDDVKVLEYSDRLKIYQAGQCLAEYPLPPDGVKNGQFSPPGLPAAVPRAHNRRHCTDAEEQHLRALAPAVSVYLDFALQTKGLQRHEFIRRLLTLSRQMSVELFSRTVERARKYRIVSLPTLERIARLYLQQGSGPLPLAPTDEAFRERETYQEGSLTDLPDLSRYQDPPPSDHE